MRPFTAPSSLTPTPAKLRPARLACLALAVVALSGCAWISDKATRVTATPGTAWAVIGNDLLTGRALLYTDRTATLELASPTDPKDEQAVPAINCLGVMRYTSSTTGLAQLHCSNGMQARMEYVAINESKGYGRGYITGDPSTVASFTYGLSPEQARAWLLPPPGRRLLLEPIRDESGDPYGLSLKLE